MKRLVKWSIDGSILKIGKALENNAAVVIEAEFDLALIFPDFKTMTEVQQQLIIYSCKQKLMDTGASEVGNAKGKIGAAKDKWAELLAGKWAGERTNATGAAENKKILAAVKDGSKAITLEGLLLKKAAYPATFTAEDQAKLDEFLARLAGKE